MKKGGFTLIELVTVIVIVGILGIGLSAYLKGGIDLWRFMSFRNEIIGQVRIAFFRMAREIRQIKNNSSIYIASASRLQFNDVDNNSIDYQLSGSNLMRNSNIMAKRVSSLQFCYYKADNSGVCVPLCGCDVPSIDLSKIYRIGVEMKVESGSQSKNIKFQVYPRNIGSLLRSWREIP